MFWISYRYTRENVTVYQQDVFATGLEQVWTSRNNSLSTKSRSHPQVHMINYE